MRTLDFGDYVRGTAMVDDGQGVRMVRPTRVVEGVVVALYAAQGQVARVQVHDANGVRTDEEVLVRVGKVFDPAPEWTV